MCEYILSIDQKWLELSENNAEIVLKLIDNEKSDNLKNIKKQITNYVNDPKSFEEETSDQDKTDLKNILKLPLIVSSYFASKESF